MGFGVHAYIFSDFAYLHEHALGWRTPRKKIGLGRLFAVSSGWKHFSSGQEADYVLFSWSASCSLWDSCFLTCSKFIIRVGKDFELGIYHHVSACPSRAASGLGEASKDLQSLFVGTGYQQNIPGTHYHLMFSSLLALASWGFHNSDFFFFIMLQE